MKSLHAQTWPGDISPTPWTGSCQPFHSTQSTMGGKGIPHSVNQVPVAPREQGEAQASLGVAN